MKRRRFPALPRPSRTLFVTMLAIASLVVALWLVTRVITVHTYEAIERRDVAAATARVRHALDAETGSLARAAADYAEWSDALAFVDGNYPQFLDNNSDPETLANLGVDFITVVWPSDGRSDGRYVSSAGTVTALPSGVTESLQTQIGAAGNPLAKPLSGVVPTADGVFLVSTNPITDSGRTVASGAYLAMGRVIDDPMAKRMSALTQLQIAFVPASAVSPPSPSGTPSPTGGSEFAQPVSEDEILGGFDIPGLSGAPAVSLRFSMPRTAHVMGNQSLTLLGLVLAAFATVACWVVGHAIVGQEREVAHRKQAQDSLRSSEERHRSLIAQMNDAVIGIDPDGLIVFANPEAARMTGLSIDAMCATRLDAVVTPESMRKIRRRESAGEFPSGSFEIELVHTSGRTVPVEVNSSPMTSEDGTVIGVQWIARDVTERKRFEHELVHMANQDYLTGLANRRRFEEELRLQIERSMRSGHGGAVLWLDVDAFKDINDSMGHQAGDKVLLGLTEATSRVVRSDSLLARLGGDEFGVLLPEASPEEAETAARRVLDAVRRAVCIVNDRRVSVTASMGIVYFPAHGTSVEEVLARADLAMYYAKEQGRNQFRVHDPGDAWESEQKSRLDWIQRIDQALSEDRLLAYVQPIVRLTDGGVDRYELLLRMQSESGQVLPPSEFLPLAERSGRIREIDRWVVRKGIQLVAEHTPVVPEFRLDVNLSGRAFSDPELLGLIRSELARRAATPAGFGVEITETAAVTDMAKARDFINALRDIGCRVALDDFGSGFSSFYYLKNLPIDALKIDGSFVQQLRTNFEDRHVVRAMAEMARALGISCTAEWVEDEKTLQLLRDFGVTFAQGFHVGEPFPAENLHERNRSSAAGGALRDAG